MLSLRTTSFLLSKGGEPQRTCEDAIAMNRYGLRFGIADGATEGFDSKRWARYLTRAWVSPSTARLKASELPEYLVLLGERQRQRWNSRQLPWYLEEKSRDGAFAAFLGLNLSRSPTWDAIAVGDCCLLIEREKSLVESFPLSRPEQFGSRPILLPSMASTFPGYMNAVQQKSGTLRAGDRMLLLSDAIACWYLRCRLEHGSVRDDFIDALANEDKNVLKEIITGERSDKHLRNDDVAIISLDIMAV